MWDTAPFVALLRHIKRLQTIFHHCPYGSVCRKLTKLVQNIPELECQREPWGQLPNGSWATSEKTVYPWNLCRSMAFQLVTRPQKLGAICATPSVAQQEESLQALRATAGVQPCKGSPRMVSEFKQVLQIPAGARAIAPYVSTY